MRAVLNIAITEMVHKNATNASKVHDNTCPHEAGAGRPEKDGFLWSEPEIGALLGVFYLGYVSDLKKIAS